MRVVVVGASGNVGTALLRRLQTEPAIDLVGVSRRRPPRSEPYGTAQAWHEIDVAEPESAQQLEAAMDGADAVVHLAWGFQPTRDPGYLGRVGVDGSARVLSAAVAAGVGHLVHMSSVGVYAPKIDNRPVDETFSTAGVPTSVYSQHKAAAEAHLDEFERDHPGVIRIARTRPGFVLQPDAGAALTRYGLPTYLPTRLIRWLPILPLDRRLIIPVIHAADLADALARILTTGAAGPFNLAATDPLDRDDIARLLHARPVNMPASVLRAAVSGTWHAHLQPLDAGWIDLAFAVPLMDTGHARMTLDWQPRIAAADAFESTIDAMAEGRGFPSPVLRPLSRADDARHLIDREPRGRQQLP